MADIVEKLRDDEVNALKEELEQDKALPKGPEG